MYEREKEKTQFYVQILFFKSYSIYLRRTIFVQNFVTTSPRLF